MGRSWWESRGTRKKWGSRGHLAGRCSWKPQQEEGGDKEVPIRAADPAPARVLGGVAWPPPWQARCQHREAYSSVGRMNLLSQESGNKAKASMIQVAIRPASSLGIPAIKVR